MIHVVVLNYLFYFMFHYLPTKFWRHIMKIGDYYIPQTKIARINDFVAADDGTSISVSNNDLYTVPLVQEQEGGDWKMIPTMKSGRYNYMEHRYAAKTYADNLQTNLEDPTIKSEFGEFDTSHTVFFKNGHSKMIIHSIPNLSYTLKDVAPIETELKSNYYKNTSTIPLESFKPRITMINDYDRVCIIQFGLYRSLCKNGMGFGNVFQNIIRFSHLNRDIVKHFHEETDKFITHIFEKKLIESIIQKMNARSINKAEVANIAAKELGKRSVKKINNAFELKDRMSLWIVYNLFTWYLSHQIKDVMRSHEVSQRIFNKFYNF